ncbi:helix-hairpin-helix domain-containing protein [Maritimibacter sp. DP1N21-5]|uniref:helix-hairpin-helix domain-containing protein n=1 Tax=Maritimibacter sp. DP1N21-5 TaxID=2836867 RepID=UPI001C477A7D|nr:helix-hairpin-helix domain-containing protein [Maritimibacter sp. DP1N21-5]MBV7409419.1 helix-hairpin-helix domain-containing protein [Maritimibacter sp. DP1N21-5]
MHELSSISGIGPAMLAQLAGIGINDVEGLAQADVMLLTTVRGISPERAEAFKAEARVILTAAEIAAKAVGSDVVEVATVTTDAASPETPASKVVGFRPSLIEGGEKAASKRKSAEQEKPEAYKDKPGKARRKALKADVKLAEAKLARQKKKLKKAEKALRKAK